MKSWKTKYTTKTSLDLVFLALIGGAVHQLEAGGHIGSDVGIIAIVALCTLAGLKVSIYLYDILDIDRMIMETFGGKFKKHTPNSVNEDAESN